MGEALSVIVEAIWDYLLPWRVVFSIGLTLLIALSVSWLVGDQSFRVDILFAGLIVGLVAGIVWQSRHR